jgi:hypothetical protein
MVEAEQVVVFLGNGRCYHTMDWFRSAQALRPLRPPVLATDLIEGEAFEKLIGPSDVVEPLLVIDPILFSTQSRAGDIWRNLVKLALLPVQAFRLRRVLRKYPGAVVHAHSMYYIALARFAGCTYVGTPQGSEALVRPYRSRGYRLFARVALGGAARVTVDSEAMQSAIRELFGIEADLIQNGIDLDAIGRLGAAGGARENVASIRGLAPNYRIREILTARNDTSPGLAVQFCYPFSEEGYKASLADELRPADRDLGRLARLDLYRLLTTAKLAISIPVSDSSPRSVYEAIFCGCAVATTSGTWLTRLPACMQARIIVVDPANPRWLQEALEFAATVVQTPYVPSPAARALYDQKRCMQRFYDDVYPFATQAFSYG